MRAIRGFEAVDKQTGEVYEILVAPKPRRNAGGRWLRLYQGMQKQLALDTSLQGQTRRVLSYLIGLADSTNHVPGPTQVGREMGIAQPVVSRAYRQLKRVGVLVMGKGSYYLSPMLCWQGRQADWERACRELLSPATTCLPQGRSRDER